MSTKTSEPTAPDETTATAVPVATTAPKKKSTAKTKRKADALEDNDAKKETTTSTEPAAKKPRTRKGTLKKKASLVNNDPPADSMKDDTPTVPTTNAPKKPKKQSAPRKKSPLSRELTPTSASTSEMGGSAIAKTSTPTPLEKKIAQLHRYLQKQPRPSLLDHDDPAQPHLISVPESSLISAICRMRMHYQLPHTPTPTLAVEEAIVSRFTRAIGSTPDIAWVTVDVSKRTEFEEEIKGKIDAERRGLGGVSLLECELEMFRLEQLKRAGCVAKGFEDDEWDAGGFLRRLEEVKGRAASKGKGKGRDVDSGEMQGADEMGESGRVGVCQCQRCDGVGDNHFVGEYGFF